MPKRDLLGMPAEEQVQFSLLGLDSKKALKACARRLQTRGAARGLLLRAGAILCPLRATANARLALLVLTQNR